MGITHYLAMTAAELHGTADLPPALGWMACHFSPFGTGISCLPRELPPGSLLILDDMTPIHGHDPKRIARQLADAAAAFQCAGVLLDFQRPDSEETAVLVKHLLDTLPCPAAVSSLYAGDGEWPVFLPPVPCHDSLSEYLLPWKGREIWLETSLSPETIALTEDGAAISPSPLPDTAEAFREEVLHCRYRMQISDEDVTFTLWRTREDLGDLLKEAEDLGISRAIGLFQELGL